MEGVPRTVLRGHDRLVSSTCILDNYIFSGDELGCLIAWKRHSEDRVDEFDLICKIQLEKSSITTVCASRNAKDGSIIRILVQIKSGSILSYAFDGMEFKCISEFACGTFTFCKMSVLSADDETLLVSFPDEKVENGISVVSYSFGEGVIKERKRILNGFIDGTSKNGMCLFSKLFHDPSCIESIFLLCGFENGRIILLKISCQCSDAYETVFDERIMEESCIDADLCVQSEELCIVAVGAGKEIKIIRIPPQYPSSSHVIKSIDLPFPGCSGVSIRPDGRVFLTAGWDCKIRYFSMKSGKALAVLDHHFDTISDVKSCLEYSLAASSDGTISVWTLYV